MAAKLEQNFARHIGEDFVLTFTVKDANDVAVNLTGATVAWTMKTHPLSPTAILSAAGGGIPSGGDNNTFTITIADTNTDAIEPRVYFHTVKVTDSSANETIVATGYGEFKP